MIALRNESGLWRQQRETLRSLHMISAGKRYLSYMASCEPLRDARLIFVNFEPSVERDRALAFHAQHLTLLKSLNYSVP